MLLLNELGIESVKHLKYTLPMLTETLSHPLSTAKMPMLSSAVEALQSVILNGWPRIVEHRGEVLKGLTLCWLKLEGPIEGDATALRQQLQETVQLLNAAIGDRCDFSADCVVLTGADGRLKTLLQIA